MEKSPDLISDSTVVMTTPGLATAARAGIANAKTGNDSKTLPITAVARLNMQSRNEE
jgi:hypothetical protein